MSLCTLFYVIAAFSRNFGCTVFDTRVSHLSIGISYKYMIVYRHCHNPIKFQEIDGWVQVNAHIKPDYLYYFCSFQDMEAGNERAEAQEKIMYIIYKI